MQLVEQRGAAEESLPEGAAHPPLSATMNDLDDGKFPTVVVPTRVDGNDRCPGNADWWRYALTSPTESDEAHVCEMSPQLPRPLL